MPSQPRELPRRTAALLWLGPWLAGAAPASAQIDYRNLDDGRPVAVEDAYPLERHALELSIGYGLARPAGNGTQHWLRPDLELGLARNLQVGATAPLTSSLVGADRKTGLAGAGLFALYNFNTESHWLPALSLGADLELPVGLGDREVAGIFKGIATRSFGRQRMHVNGWYALGGDTEVEEARWAAAVAVDHTMIRHSTLLIWSLEVLQPRDGLAIMASAGFGIRRQLTPTTVLDLGASRRITNGRGNDFAASLGISTVMGVPWARSGGRTP